MKKYVLFVLSVVLILIISCFTSLANADRFCDDPIQINEAAKSVMMLEVYKDGEIIATGSGFVAFDNRHLITNYHVADEADMIYAYSDAGDPYIIMDVCIADSKKDLAILQFFSPTDLKPSELKEEGEILRAASVVAIGSPKGFSNTVSKGNVSSLYEEDGVSYIQFTAPISTGSSGGALFDDEGKIIGITTLLIADSKGTAQNLNFAVNIKEAITLYGTWNGEYTKLTDIKSIDVNTPEPTATPTPTSTPAPTRAPTPIPTSTPESTPGTHHLLWEALNDQENQRLITITKCEHYFLKDDINLKFKVENHTDKTIKEFTINVIFFESRGGRYYPIVGYGGSIKIKKTIEPGDFEMSYWSEFKFSKRTKMLTGSVSSVTYADGTTEKKEKIFGEIQYFIDN